MEEKDNKAVAANEQPEREKTEDALYRIELGPMERKVLITLAVTGEPETLDDLSDSTELDPAELESILGRLQVRGIVRRVRSETDPDDC